MPTLKRWLHAFSRLAIPPDDRLRALHADLVRRHAEPHRHYHTLQHLGECFEWLSRLEMHAENPAAVELAIWFHDAIHEPGRNDNERRSAQLASASLALLGMKTDVIVRVRELVLLTRHDAEPRDADGRVMNDVDLAVLGAGPERFAEYERQLRREYAQVPEFVYRRERRKLLESFLARNRIFLTPPARERLEARARANITAVLEHL